MNYVWYHLKNNPKFWIQVVAIPAVLVLAVLDFLSNMFQPPGIFNLWFFKIVVFLSFTGTIGYGIYLFVSPKREKKIILEQYNFEKEREIEFKRILSKDPEFQTFCYTCKHFNLELKCCRLNIRNSKARNVRLNNDYTYCLYWDSSQTVEPEPFRSF